MSMNLELLKERSRHTYELGRFRFGLQALFVIVPLAIFSSFTCGTPTLVLILGSFLAISSIYFLWLGQNNGRAAWKGLLAGATIAVVPLFLELVGLCPPSGYHGTICAWIGFLGGLFVASQSSRVKFQRTRYLAISAMMIALTSAMGCAVFGIGALVALGVGVLVPTIPAYFWFRRAVTFR